MERGKEERGLEPNTLGQSISHPSFVFHQIWHEGPDLIVIFISSMSMFLVCIPT